MRVQELKARSFMSRHRHSEAYAAIILEGQYEEIGDSGHWRLSAGDIVVHRRFEAHQNQVGAFGALVFNLAIGPLPLRDSVFRLKGADRLVASPEAWENDAISVLAACEPRQPEIDDWPDQLAFDLRADPGLCIGAWAQAATLARETVSRGFKRVYGVTPAAYRAQARTRAALEALINGRESLVETANAAGFADQAHMSRAIVSLTGRTPKAWRQVKSIQESGAGDLY